MSSQVLYTREFNIFNYLQYDEVTSNANQFHLPSGHCDIPMVGLYDSTMVMSTYNGFVNKFTLLVLSGVYYYKYVTEVENLKQIQDQACNHCWYYSWPAQSTLGFPLGLLGPGPLLGAVVG